jgi:hypothetical protein
MPTLRPLLPLLLAILMVNWLIITPWPLALIALYGALLGFRHWRELNGAVQHRAFLRLNLSMVLTAGLRDVGRALPLATLLSAAALAQLGTVMLILWHRSGGLGRAARWASGVGLGLKTRRRRLTPIDATVAGVHWPDPGRMIDVTRVSGQTRLPVTRLRPGRRLPAA